MPRMNTRNFLILLSLAVTFFLSNRSHAQLPDGSLAPNFVVTDSNGETHELYAYLDQGYTVILQLFAAWSGPDWNYHNAGTSHPFPGALNEVYNLYGPEGTNEIMVIAIESDPNTDPSQITGGEFSIGDWTAGVDYPVADDEGILALYELTYFPTIFTICPNRLLTLSGQVSAAEHYSIAEAIECQPASFLNDPAILEFVGQTEFCQSAEISVSLMNLGLNLLTEVDFEISYNGSLVDEVTWSGVLETYGVEQADLGSYALAGDGQLEIQITSFNGNPDNDLLAVPLLAPVAATQDVQVTINTDSWGDETGWSITNEFGNVVAGVPAGTYASQTQYIENVQLGSGCYYFELTDAYGDGMNGSFWGGVDGSCIVESFADGELYSTVFEEDGSGQWAARGIYLLVGSNPGCLDPLACNYVPDADIFVNCSYPGCDDPGACNYDPSAGCDDGSCTYPGCNIVSACNYDADAGCDDGSCLFPGCNDPLACNYDALAGCENDACTYPVEVLITGPVVVSAFSSSSYSVVEQEGLSYQWEVTGGAITGSDEASVVEVFWGPQGTGEICMTIDQASCPTQTECINVVIAPDNALPGCTNSSACNYNPNATTDNGSCFFVGDPCNDGDPNTINDAVQSDCECAGETVNEVPGCTNASACNYDADASLDDGSCFFVGDPCNDGDPNTINDAVQSDCECAGETVNEVPGCTNASACNYDADASLDDGSCFFVGDACDDGNANTINDSIQANCECEGEDPDPSTGCTDPEACNYSPDATNDDGSCEYVELFEIEGNLTPQTFTSESYTYPGGEGSVFEWDASGGTITSGNNTNAVELTWGTMGNAELCVVETRADGCSGQEICVNVVILPTSVQEISEQKTALFPNPAREVVNIHCPSGGVHVSLFDCRGSLLKTEFVHNDFIQWQIGHLSSGVYFIHLSSKAWGVFTHQLIID